MKRFITTLSVSFFICVVSILISVSAYAQVNDIERATPESQGVESRAIYGLFDTLTSLDKVEIHSTVVMRNGKIIGELYPKPFSKEYKHTIYSCSKSFVALAVGIAIDENRLRLDDRVAVLFADQLPDTISDYLAEITVRDLLTMTSGINTDWGMRSKCDNWIATYLAKEVKDKPGEVFKYDSISTYMLSAIVQKVTGKKVLDYLKEKAFNYMNITDVQWQESPEGINTGGWGMYAQPESLAKFGQLILNKGKWNDRQIVSEKWVEEMTKNQVQAKPNEFYGYQMWECNYPTAVRADGALGQYIFIIPKKNAVVVVTQCCMMDAETERSNIWKMLDDMGDEPIEENEKEYKKLLKKQSEYAFTTVKGKSDLKKLSKLYNGKKINLKNNSLGWKNAVFYFEKDKVVLQVEERNGIVHNIEFGYNKWLTTWSKAYPHYSLRFVHNVFGGIDSEFAIAGSYAWNKKEETLNMEAHYVNWVTSLKFKIKFSDSGVEMEVKENYAKKPFNVKGEFVK